MLPRLEAEESMLEAERLFVGTGSVEKRTSSRIRHRWRRQMALERPAQPAPTTMLAGIGIGFREVKKA